MVYPKNVVHVWLCSAVFRRWSVLPTSFRVTSLALGQSNDCPNASEATLKDMGNIESWVNYELITQLRQNKTKQNHVHILWNILKTKHSSLWIMSSIKTTQRPLLSALLIAKGISSIEQCHFLPRITIYQLKYIFNTDKNNLLIRYFFCSQLHVIPEAIEHCNANPINGWYYQLGICRSMPSGLVALDHQYPS